MDISILTGATDLLWVLDIGDIPEDDARPAGWLTLKSWSHTNGNEVRESPVDVDVVGTAEDGWVDVGSQVAGGGVGSIESNGLGWVDGKELRHIEDLDTVVKQFTSDDHVVFVTSQLVPDGSRIKFCIRCTTANVRTRNSDE